MRWSRRWREKHQRLDERIAEAEGYAAAAEEEARLSQVRHDSVMERTVKPLRAKDKRNHFADLIRASLTEGGQ